VKQGVRCTRIVTLHDFLNWFLLEFTVAPSDFEVTLCFVYIQVVSSAIVDKYIGESARLIREMFNYARDHQPCIIFMDEIDAIGVYMQFP
jgi:hypothetical protein